MEQATAKIIASSTAGEQVCAAAGRISTTQGSALEVFARSGEKENNGSLIEKVVASGHESVIEHAMFTVAFDNVSVCTEEFVIEFRLASFTVQSRRYVDYSSAGFCTPPLPDALTPRYQAHMQSLFDAYAKLLALDIPKEDARFVLPYCFRSNFYCTLNARELMHLISAMRWGRGAAFPELKKLGESLCIQFAHYFPNIPALLQKKLPTTGIHTVLPDVLPDIPEPTVQAAETVLRGASPDAAETVLRAAASNWTICRARDGQLADIVRGERPRELELVQAQFEIRNLSLAAVTHLVRHRMQTVLVPQVTQAVLQNTFLLPDSVAQNPAAEEVYRSAFAENAQTARTMLADGLPHHALQYFALAGNQVNVVCAMNGRELLHFMKLRTCSRAQWEIRACAVSLLRQLRTCSPALYDLYGPSCFVSGACPEGRLSCGNMQDICCKFAQTQT